MGYHKGSSAGLPQYSAGSPSHPAGRPLLWGQGSTNPAVLLRGLLPPLSWSLSSEQISPCQNLGQHAPFLITALSVLSPHSFSSLLGPGLSPVHSDSQSFPSLLKGHYRRQEQLWTASSLSQAVDKDFYLFCMSECVARTHVYGGQRVSLSSIALILIFFLNRVYH